MRIDILTLFPNICTGPLNESMMKRAQAAGAVEIGVHNIRDWARDKHRVTDDTPYGGGPGMVMKAEPVFNAVEELRTPGARVILLTPQGRVFRQAKARELARLPHLIFICGHYEGVDHRIVEHLVDEELSLGDFVLTNGAVAANVVVDAVVRLIPGVLGHDQSAELESFADPGLLEGPHYTKPPEFRGWKVPDILLGGNHAAIEKWRKAQGRLRTQQNRPDLPGALKRIKAMEPPPEWHEFTEAQQLTLSEELAHVRETPGTTCGCPACGQELRYIYHRYREGKPKGLIVIWCANCRASFANESIIPPWWRNLALSIDIPDYRASILDERWPEISRHIVDLAGPTGDTP